MAAKKVSIVGDVTGLQQRQHPPPPPPKLYLKNITALKINFQHFVRKINIDDRRILPVMAVPIQFGIHFIFPKSDLVLIK